jgi:putative transcriptional regulator
LKNNARPFTNFYKGVYKVKSLLMEILKEEGRTQTWLCKQVGVSNTTMTSLVNNKRLPTLPVAYKIARALGRKIEDIWYEE